MSIYLSFPSPQALFSEKFWTAHSWRVRRPRAAEGIEVMGNSPEHQSARMSKIKKGGLDQHGPEHFNPFNADPVMALCFAILV